jgi:hypothetical protein
VLPALRRRALGELRAAAPRDQVGQPVPLEEVAEAVPDRDLGDLGDPAEVATLLGGLGHGVSVPRGRGDP